jgi:flagellar basal-body rod protein FlgB
MSPKIFNDATMRSLTGALTGLTTREQVISSNLANVDTPGFKASTVSFEAQLQRTLQQTAGEGDEVHLVSSHPAHFADLAESSNVVEPVVTVTNTVGRNDGNNVDVDREMVSLAETGLAYTALTRLIAKRMATLRAAVTEVR